MKKSITKKLHHIFFPHTGNNHRSKALHHSSLVIVLLFLICCIGISRLLQTNAPDVLGISYSISESDLLTATNNARAENGLPPLVVNTRLVQAATGKAHHMMANNYWAHFAPDGTTPWSFMKSNDYDYIYAGENLAKGFTDSQTIVDAWLKSPSHRENLLSPKYNEIGFAILEGNLTGEDTVLVVQMFGATEASLARARSEAPPTQNESLSQRQQNISNGEVQPVKTQNTQELAPSTLENSPIFDAQQISQIITLVVFSVILFALLADLFIVSKKKIPRLVGNNMDHILLIAIFIILIFLQTSGGVI